MWWMHTVTLKLYCFMLLLNPVTGHSVPLRQSFGANFYVTNYAFGRIAKSVFIQINVCDNLKTSVIRTDSSFVLQYAKQNLHQRCARA